MLERTQRPLTDEDRGLIARHRRNEIGKTRIGAAYATSAGAIGLLVGFVWLILFHWGDRNASVWPLLAFVVAGAASGFPFDLARARSERRRRTAVAAARWDPPAAAGVVEHIVAEATAAVRLDDNSAETAWFLQVADRQILCVWDWSDDASERVTLDLLPGPVPAPLRIAWSGNRLVPLRPKRAFKHGERRPEQCEVIDGRLDELDRLLRVGTRTAGDSTRPPTTAPTTRLATLANDVEPLGFYKFTSPEDINAAKAELARGARSWYRASGRSFDADAEALAEGGVQDLLDYMRPALEREGWVLGPLEGSYDVRRGYTLRIGDRTYTLWDESEREKTWALTTGRVVTLVNEGLLKAGSKERVHILGGGEDAVFVLLTAALRETVVDSGVISPDDVPAEL